MVKTGLTIFRKYSDSVSSIVFSVAAILENDLSVVMSRNSFVKKNIPMIGVLYLVN